MNRKPGHQGQDGYDDAGHLKGHQPGVADDGERGRSCRSQASNPEHGRHHRFGNDTRPFHEIGHTQGDQHNTVKTITHPMEYPVNGALERPCGHEQAGKENGGEDDQDQGQGGDDAIQACDKGHVHRGIKL